MFPNDPEKSWLEWLFDYFGILKKYESKKEAAFYSRRQQKLSQLNTKMEESFENYREAAGWVPLYGAALEISIAASKNDNTAVIANTILLGIDAVPGGNIAKTGVNAGTKAFRAFTRRILGII